MAFRCVFDVADAACWLSLLIRPSDECLLMRLADTLTDASLLVRHADASIQVVANGSKWVTICSTGCSWPPASFLNYSVGVAFCQEDAWAILKFHPKWDAPKQVDLTGDVPGATQEDLFGHDARPRPAGKPRPAKKTKSDATASIGGSSASTQFEELMERELRLKRKAAKRAFEAQAEKDRTLMRLEELRFLATSTKDLDDDDAYWIKKQKRLIKNKMRNDLGDEDDEDE
nr:hypothetical protein [Tanacetum cinerariifolium]